MLGANDGVLGLALQNGLGKCKCQRSVIYEMFFQRQVKSAIFSIWLNGAVGTPVNESFAAQAGQLTMGGYDSSKFTGNISYIPVSPIIKVDSNGTVTKSFFYWSVTATNIFNEQLTSIPPTSNSTVAVFDIGTVFIWVDRNTVDRVAYSLNQVHGANTVWFDNALNLYLLNCAFSTTLPDLSFVLGPQNNWFALKNEEYVIRDGDGKCVFGIQSNGNAVDNGVATTQWVLGSIFMRRYLTVFDLGKKKVGLASAVTF
ncbi:UNVERIFIED_CONTAM: hypothetical protein HDU68_012650 [Siphonaria sp. JEL0065]|nr:hypothetical protein HDU68_012650 [Siphonaria sp. JEL0065]